MAGVGIDLLEIERLERALARRPRLADRLFTDGERAYAATRARPAMHLAARFCAKEAVAKALQLREWSWRDVEVLGGGDEPPSVRLTGAAAEQGGRARRDRDGVAHPHARDGGRGGGAELRLPGWIEPLLTAEEMRAVDAWAIETKGVPSLELMERAGEGLARVIAAARAGRPDRDRLRQGQQRRRRPGGRAAAAGGRARGRRAGRVAAGDAAGRRAGAAAPAARARAGAVRAPGGSTARTRSSTRCSAPARPARRATRRPA